VYSYDPVSLQTAILSIVSFFFNFKFYSATHTVASVYPAYYEYDSWNFYKKLYLQLTDGFLGYITGLNVRICYAMTQDGLEISNKFFKINKNKLKLISLPIDTTIFNPFNTNDKIRQNVRMKLGSNSNEIICIYTGRLTDAKNPLCLALAINKLINMGYSYKAVFIGEGEQFESISKLKGCKVMPFIPYANLPDYYLASDIGVWPRQESLSMNDAVACGLPIIVSNKMKAIERIDGNGLTYEENNFEDLANALINLQDVAFRHKLGHFGSKKIKSKYSCELISEIYINDFKSNKHNT
jgi:glycosyltransferase involved in cell wall biosynthesis